MADYVHRQYYGDDGVAYDVRVPTYYTVAASPNAWNHGLSGGEPPLPRGLRMRRWHLYDSVSGKRRQFPVDTTASARWPEPAFTVTLPNIDGTTTTYNVVGYSGERDQPLTNRKRH